MKLNAPNLPTLAAFFYALFAAIGIAVWCILVYVAAPQMSTSSSAWDTSLQMLQPGIASSSHLLHAVFTLLAAAFAVLLLVKSVATPRRHLVASAAAVIYAASVWFVFDFKTAILPTAAALAMSIAWFRAIRGPKLVNAS